MLKIYKLLKPYTVMVIGIFVLVACQAIGDLYLPTLMADIINDGVMQGNINKILQIGGVMLLIALAVGVCSILASLLSAQTASGLGKIIRSKIFTKVESFSLHEFDKFGTATLITRSTNDITQIQTVTVIIMRMMISAPIMCIGGIILAFRKDYSLTWILGVSIPVLALLVAGIASKMIPLFRQVQVKIDKINLVLREKLTGVRVIRAFNAIKRERKRFGEANIDLTENYIKVNKIMAFMMPSITLIMNFTTLAILWFGGVRISEGTSDLGALSAFTQYAMQIMMSMLMMTMMFIMVPRSQAAAARINEVLGTVPGIKDPMEIKDCFVGRGNVEFKDVTFTYPGAEEPALKNISFSAKPAQVTAIIGSTGSGKSTLINLIPRFYDIDSGSILVDGLDVREISQECLRSKIGFVPQKAILFSGTITDNIKFGKSDATFEDVRYVADIAQAAHFIESLDDGYEHLIAQGGTNISGGQKQRISIARALVRRPEIYIFDDSFSALDFKTDAALRAALKKETKEATVIIVAQRVGSVMDADRIIVLEKGSIVGMGAHKELMKTCEVYQEIVFSQFSEEEIV